MVFKKRTKETLMLLSSRKHLNSLLLFGKTQLIQNSSHLTSGDLVTHYQMYSIFNRLASPLSSQQKVTLNTTLRRVQNLQDACLLRHHDGSMYTLHVWLLFLFEN